jgi:hypothetical protein
VILFFVQQNQSTPSILTCSQVDMLSFPMLADGKSKREGEGGKSIYRSTPA